MSVEVRVPTLGESVTEATVATWFKKPGDAVGPRRDAVRAGNRQGDRRGALARPARWARSSPARATTVGVDALLATLSEDAAAAPARPRRPSRTPPSAPATPTRSRTSPGRTAAAPMRPRGGERIDVPVPTLGESVTEATVASWFKAVGDSVEQDEMLCELETDKVSVEVPAPVAGTLAEIVADEGATVAAGGRLAVMTTGAVANAAGPTPADAAPAAAETATASAGGADTDPGDVAHAPAAEKLMAEKGLSADQVQGTGRGGRIMKEDVMRAIDRPSKTPAARRPRTRRRRRPRLPRPRRRHRRPCRAPPCRPTTPPARSG